MIFAKYRMITRWGNMSFFIYDYYFLFFSYREGGIIMLKNGKRESLNSFKSCTLPSEKLLLEPESFWRGVFSYYN